MNMVKLLKFVGTNIALLFVILSVFLLPLFAKPCCISQQCDWEYHGRVIPNDIIGGNQIKDPEYIRYSNFSLYQDSQGFYYLITTSNFGTAIFKTADFLNFTFISVLNNYLGKIAPYGIALDNGSFLIYYSDWFNVYVGDINFALMGMLIGDNLSDPSSFTDLGYLNINNTPIAHPSAGWDPYIIENNPGEYVLYYSTAKHGVHIATSSSLGLNWTYSGSITDEDLENSAMFYYNSTWYMILGIWYGSSYDLFCSTSLIDNWTKVCSNWFVDEKLGYIPSGSTITQTYDNYTNQTILFHLYQVPLNYVVLGPLHLAFPPDLISGPFELHLATTYI